MAPPPHQRSRLQARHLQNAEMPRQVPGSRASPAGRRNARSVGHVQWGLAPRAAPSPRGPTRQRMGPSSSAGCTLPQMHIVKRSRNPDSERAPGSWGLTVTVSGGRPVAKPAAAGPETPPRRGEPRPRVPLAFVRVLGSGLSAQRRSLRGCAVPAGRETEAQRSLRREAGVRSRATRAVLCVPSAQLCCGPYYSLHVQKRLW